LIDVPLESPYFYTFWLFASLTGAAILTVIGVVFLVWGTRVRVPDFESQMAALNLEAATVRERASNLELRTAALEKEAQELKATNLALQAKIQPRRLSGENSAKLASALAALQPMPLAVVSRLFDPESADFADDLAAAFINAKWEALRQKDWTTSSKGLALGTLDGTTIAPSLAIGLLEALRGANVEATVTIIPQTERQTTSVNFQPNILYLLVGAKP